MTTTGYHTASNAARIVIIIVIYIIIITIKKLKAKASDSYIVRLRGKPDQPHFTVIKVAADWQEPVVLQR